MRMSAEEFTSEYIYASTMTQVKKMICLGLISDSEYWRINTKMKDKYRPVSDGLISELDLICAKSRAIVVAKGGQDYAKSDST